ncbi:MAG: SDR family oxidoreductase [Lunatimonas sp.]|uniref:D-erythronate dehydrogenase n=1 Tax=Lunatimonas sp. TaxID=2060141 RepID=UPI00263A8703|nr:D-erythronate dehydrogenase [Lunatimonas sp.]MCC5936921.1 SDR family oxidoreductase [Lunatimonas sp.]
MHAVVIGGGGFVGSRLARELVKVGAFSQGKITKITLMDREFPEELLNEGSFHFVVGDFSEEQVIRPVLEQRPELIFHLAAVVSGEAEKNFELGMKVNLHGSLQLLEICRELAHKPRVIFASSCGVFGGDVTQVVADTTAPKPRSSYGTQKAIVELLVNDYSRRGFVDGRTLRLPTITVRPGKPNAATSSFLSGIIREPLHGVLATYPVSEDSAFWLLSPKRVVQNFIHAAKLGSDLLGDDRIITLPGITASVGQLLESLRQVAGEEVAKRAVYEPDAFLQGIVLTWPPNFEPTRALELGFVRDASTEEIIRNYIEEEGVSVY